MKDIQNTEWLDSLADDLRQEYTNLSDYAIIVIAKRIKNIFDRSKEKNDVKTASEYAAQDLMQIKRELKAVTKRGIEEIDKIFNKVASANVDFANDYLSYRKVDTIESTKDVPVLDKMVNAEKEKQVDALKNLSKTTTLGFIDNKSNFLPLREQYIKVINTAVETARSGDKDFYQTIRPLIKGMTNSGLKQAFFDNEGKKPYVRRIDSQVRMNVKDGIHTLNSEMHEELGKEFEADGYEISVHSLCAPDHQSIQGKQFTKEEYEKLNDRLERKIGELNCGHFAIPIIMGVSKPVHTAKELQEYNKRSNEKVEYVDAFGEVKQTSRYEASQIQRKYELKIRDLRSQYKALKQIGDIEGQDRAKQNLIKVTADYKRFSNKVGLTVRIERTK